MPQLQAEVVLESALVLGLDTDTAITPGNSLQCSPDGRVQGWGASPLQEERFQQSGKEPWGLVSRSFRDGVSKAQYVTCVPALPVQLWSSTETGVHGVGLLVQLCAAKCIFHQKIRKCHFFCSVFLPLSDNIKCFCIITSGFYQPRVFFPLCFVFWGFFVSLPLLWVQVRKMKISHSVSWLCSININYAC